MHHLLHHANCADGFAAACIARHALLTLTLTLTLTTKVLTTKRTHCVNRLSWTAWRLF
jgi:hypothetical protein